MRISDWSSDVCSSDLRDRALTGEGLVISRTTGPCGADGRCRAQVIRDQRAAAQQDDGRNDNRDLHGRDSRGSPALSSSSSAPRGFTRNSCSMTTKNRGTKKMARKVSSEEHTSELKTLMRTS